MKRRIDIIAETLLEALARPDPKPEAPRPPPPNPDHVSARRAAEALGISVSQFRSGAPEQLGLTPHPCPHRRDDKVWSLTEINAKKKTPAVKAFVAEAKTRAFIATGRARKDA